MTRARPRSATARAVVLATLAGSARALASTLAPARAGAQIVLADDVTQGDGVRGHLEASFLNEFDTQTRGGDEWNAWRVGLDGGVEGAVDEGIRVGLRAAYQHADYAFHFDHAVRPADYGGRELPRAPWGGVNTIDLAPTATAAFGERFAAELAVPIRWSGETGARRNAFAAGVTGLARVRILDGLSLGAGAGITSQLEGPAQIFPVVALDWRILPGLALRTQGSFVQGGRAMLLWGASDAVRLVLSAAYERNRFRLDDNGIADDRHGIGEVEAVPVEIGFRIGLFERGYLDFRAGFGFAGSLRVENANGRRLYADRYDPAPRLGLALSIPLGGARQRAADASASGAATYDDVPPSVIDPDAPPARP
ncbi:MAG: hypothetical protein R3F35_05305 [Myxococcota bacterium]